MSQISMFMAQSGPINMSLVALSTIEFTISALSLSPNQTNESNQTPLQEDHSDSGSEIATNYRYATGYSGNENIYLFLDQLNRTVLILSLFFSHFLSLKLPLSPPFNLFLFLNFFIWIVFKINQIMIWILINCLLMTLISLFYFTIRLFVRWEIDYERPTRRCHVSQNGAVLRRTSLDTVGLVIILSFTVFCERQFWDEDSKRLKVTENGAVLWILRDQDFAHRLETKQC